MKMWRFLRRRPSTNRLRDVVRILATDVEKTSLKIDKKRQTIRIACRR